MTDPMVVFRMDDAKLDELDALVANIEALVTDLKTRGRIMATLAREAGPILYASVMESLDDYIYSDAPYGTGALKDAHELIYPLPNMAMVRVNPEAAAGDCTFNFPHNAKVGRITVGEYAKYVHDGYVQWVLGRNTGVYHPGRKWLTFGYYNAIGPIMEQLQVVGPLLVSQAVFKGTIGGETAPAK
jgi:hypothetical protein